MVEAVTVAALLSLVSISGSSDVFRLVGDSVQLDTQRPVPEFDDLFWMFNGSTIIKYFPESKKTRLYPGYEDRVEFNEGTYSLTLKNLQKTDSGPYEARASNHKVTFVAEYRLSVWGSSDVFRLVGDSVQLDMRDTVPEFDDLSWISNGSINVLKYFNDTKRTHPAYEGRVEFNNRTYSLTLKNLQKTDSGLYEARASNHEMTVVAVYRLSVLDPVEAPVLTHQVNTDTCNITLTCRGHDLSFNSSCYKKTCEEKNETSPGGVALSLSGRGSSIICNHSNPASWKNKTLEMGELTRSCTDGRKGEHSAPGDDSKSTGVVVSIVVPVAVVIIISISVYMYWRRSAGNTQREDTGNRQEEMQPMN